MQHERRTNSRGHARSRKIKQRAVASLEAELLRRVRANSNLSRVALARQLHLAPSTVGAYVDRLIAEGFLSERPKPERDFGRPPTLLGLNPQGGRFIGVDFEAHNLMATVVDFSQQPMHQLHKPLRSTDTVDEIIGKIESAIAELMEGDPREVLGIGIGVPGIIDPKTQAVLHYEHIRGWKNIPLGERLMKRFKVDVFLENNIRSMALAEMWFGQGRGVEDFVCLGIRTGIAAGIVAGGHLLHGGNNLAGEIGGWLCPVAPMTARKEGGKTHSLGCKELRPLEEIASIDAITDRVYEALARTGTTEARSAFAFEKVVDAARAGDAFTNQVLDEVAQSLAWVVCQINGLFNPKKIILAGPLVSLGRGFLDPVRHWIKHFCAEFYQEAPQVVDSELGEFNGALGAAALALHQWKPKRRSL